MAKLLASTRQASAIPRWRRCQRGTVTIEFVLVLLFGLTPLLLLTFTGILIFAAKQSLTLAATEGARAAVRYGSLAERRTAACEAASAAMQWLLTYSGDAPNCTDPAAAPITVTVPGDCAATADTPPTCVQVSTSFDYNAHPLLPATGIFYHWILSGPLVSTANIQFDPDDSL